MGPVTDLLIYARSINEEENIWLSNVEGKWGAVHMQGSTGLGERWRDNVRKLWQELPEGEPQKDKRNSHDLTFLVCGTGEEFRKFFLRI